MAVEGCGVVLRQNEDLCDQRINAIGNRHIDQAIFAAERNGGFRSLAGQREKY